MYRYDKVERYDKILPKAEQLLADGWVPVAVYSVVGGTWLIVAKKAGKEAQLMMGNLPFYL